MAEDNDLDFNGFEQPGQKGGQNQKQVKNLEIEIDDNADYDIEHNQANQNLNEQILKNELN